MSMMMSFGNYYVPIAPKPDVEATWRLRLYTKYGIVAPMAPEDGLDDAGRPCSPATTAGMAR